MAGRGWAEVRTASCLVLWLSVSKVQYWHPEFFLWSGLLAVKPVLPLLAWALVLWVRSLQGTQSSSTEILGCKRKSSVVNYQAPSGLKLPWRRSSGSMWCVWLTQGWEHGLCGFSTKEKGKSAHFALLTSILLGLRCFLLVPQVWVRVGERKVKWA